MCRGPIVLASTRVVAWACATLALIAAGCASGSPEQAAREALMWEAARECQLRFSEIMSIERIDNYGRLHYTYEGSSDTRAFETCYQVRLEEKLAAANLVAPGRISAGPGKATRTTVPVTMARDMALVGVVVNEEHHATLIMDTGSSQTVLSPAFAKRVGISPGFSAPSRIVQLVGGQTITMPLVRARSLAVGTVAVEDLDVGVYDVLPNVTGVDGLLGADFLQHFRFLLDRNGRQLTLEVAAPGGGDNTRQVTQPVASPAVSPPASAEAFAVLEPPRWSVGDEWAFSSEGPTGRSTFTWRVAREETLDGVPHYVIKSGTRDIFFRTSDLAVTQETVGGVLVLRNTPPHEHYAWPLAVGVRWEQSYRRERPVDRQTTDFTYVASVDGDETITVPAGTFRTLRIVYRRQPRNAVNWEQWYSPDARMWVRMRELLEEGVRTRELTAFTRAAKPS